MHNINFLYLRRELKKLYLLYIEKFKNFIDDDDISLLFTHDGINIYFYFIYFFRYLMGIFLSHPFFMTPHYTFFNVFHFEILLGFFFVY